MLPIMSATTSDWTIPAIGILFAFVVILSAYVSKPFKSDFRLWLLALSTSSTGSFEYTPLPQQDAAPTSRTGTQDRNEDAGGAEDLASIKQLYYQLHCLEEHPSVLPAARRLLLSLLKETSSQITNIPPHENILTIRHYSRKNVEDFQHRRNDHIGEEWEGYNARRKAGGGRELFGDKEDAIWWLKQISPVKYVDGAWLGHVGTVTTPFALHKTVKGACQILFEELGDGDLRKNHVNLYHRLLESVAPGFPTAETEQFGQAETGLNNLSVWKAATAQLLISLMPNEFLPEILGFNLHFEGISMDTLKAISELREVGIDPYYFILHVSIDNSHSGHSAIAIEIVSEYMKYILKKGGEAAAQKAWEKIQAGYLLSLGMPCTVTSPSKQLSPKSHMIALSPIEEDVIAMFKAKSKVVQGLHCCSRVLIGERRVADWLNPDALESPLWQRNLLDALSSSRYWICRGASGKSRFMRELQWNGRMFGSFTQAEYETLRSWIDGMPNISQALRSSDSAHILDSTSTVDSDILSGHPELRPVEAFWSNYPLGSSDAIKPFSFRGVPALHLAGTALPEKLFPMWLAHPCLLQGFVAVPFRTRNHFACTIVKILRAQGGFEVEQECIAGLDEFQRPEGIGLIGIGTNMLSAQDVGNSEVSCLKDVLQKWPLRFAVDLLHLSERPVECKGLLIGMSTAFAKMHEAMLQLEPPLLSSENQDILRDIAEREMDGLEICWEELEADEKAYLECCRGYLIAAEEVQKCFAAS